ncbi:TRAP transporter small permease [Chelatococcus sp. SYSU_G07232]|uniref:TRAP transporter small permease protein n=1 Tax=Chelatococcus albus TaxID=3047466 RepID=A0ABT7ALC3_9HYPH|nr:TRAP transporter small permease [Chelatococcus sp. SYSU_G07232]MDJ1160175.1 TRAP transporter small permease [Chelatococcus sp. SYSU_G07232]
MLAALKNAVDAALRLFIGLIVCVLLAAVVWQVVSRYVLNAPSTITEEVSRYALIWLGLMGTAYAVGQGRHMAFTTLVGALPPQRGALLLRFANLLVLAFASVVMVGGGWRLTYRVFIREQLSSVMEIPMAYVYAVVPLAGVLCVFYAVLALLDHRFLVEPVSD